MNSEELRFQNLADDIAQLSEVLKKRFSPSIRDIQIAMYRLGRALKVPANEQAFYRQTKALRLHAARNPRDRKARRRLTVLANHFGGRRVDD